MARVLEEQGISTVVVNLNRAQPERIKPPRCLLLNYTRVSDLTPLRGMPLEFLDLRSSQVTNLSALEGMPLHSVAFPVKQVTGGADALRGNKRIKLINRTKPENFWLLYDRGLLGNPESSYASPATNAPSGAAATPAPVSPEPAPEPR